MIDAIYLISRTGVPIYFKEHLSSKEDNIDQVTLFSGVISAIQSVLSETKVGTAKYFATSTNEVFMEISEKFGVILIKNLDESYSREIIEKILSEITTEIVFNFPNIDEHFIINKEQEQKINTIIKKIIEKYEVSASETKEISGNYIDYYLSKKSKAIGDSFLLLMNAIQKNFETVFYALIVGEPIIVCGNKNMVQEVIHNLKIASPFPFHNIIECTNAYISPQIGSIIGISQDLEEKYRETDSVIINVEKKTAFGSTKPNYLKNLVKKLRKIKNELEIKEKIEEEVINILTRSSQLLEMYSSGNLDREQYLKFKKQIPEDLFNLITTICVKINPSLKEIVEKYTFFGFAF
ncbi:MAG: hypothetical protein ACTSQE_12870 [Candidatus Heimdallarchaeaceae archaeon]